MSSLYDAFRSVSVRSDVETDINLMTEVSDLYVWPHEDQVRVEDGRTVAVVDLNGELGCVIDQVKAACEDCSVFQIVNHGVQQDLVERVREHSQRLFSLPLEKKMLAQRSPDGATGYGMARIARLFSKRMWSEVFACVGSPSEQAKLLWPNDYQEFCELVEKYDVEMKKLASKLLSLILQSLGLKATDYARWCGDGYGEGKESCGGALQMNHYPSSPCPSQTIGMAAHTDSTFLTVLYQGGVAGLEIKRSDGSWMLVPAIPNAFVVSIGDLLQVVSNGRYKSVVHRAVSNSRGRLSLAYLWGPPLSAMIEAAPELVDSEHPRLYRPLTWQEYLVAREKNFHEALQLFEE